MLTLIRRLKQDPRKALYQCECGKRVVLWISNASTGHTQSCGCYRRRKTSERSTKHGHKAGYQRTRTYVIWMNMKARCTNPSARLYERYGGRGIGYDTAWESFEAFLRDMGEAPADRTIDRIDNSAGYSKANCRWASPSEQAVNKSSIVLYEWNGQRRSVADWARQSGIQRLTLRHRLKNGWPIERALTEKPKKKN
jgi:hypothetical protein